MSEREGLGELDGMLFVYDGAEIRNFWMKGMKFPLDIIYESRELADYVLEMGPGFARKYGIEVGDGVDIRR